MLAAGWRVPGLTVLIAALLAACSPFSKDLSGNSSQCFDNVAAAEVEGYESLDQMAWFSHVIVVGTVSEPQGTRRSPNSQTYFVTDYTIEVDRWIRGNAANSDQVLIRVLGGEIVGCVQRWGEPIFEPGDRAVFFLRDYEGSTPPRYDVFGWWQGFWHIDANDMVTTTMKHLRPQRYPTALDQFVDLIRTELEDGPPPPSRLVSENLVPLDESPVYFP